MLTRKAWPLSVLLGLAACAGILGLEDLRHASFSHRAHTTLGITCIGCHPGIEEAGDQGPLHLPTNESCLLCHPAPHDPGDCRGCHGDPGTEARLAAARHHLSFSHAQHLPELSGNCAKCHLGVAEDDEKLLPKMANCFRCHNHEDQFAGRNCDTCHQDLVADALEPSSHVAHNEGFVRSHGAQAASATDLCRQCHSEASCAKCHGVSVPVLPARLAFDAPAGPNFHRAAFRSRHTLEARADSGLCLTCHSTQSCANCHETQGLSAAGTPRGSPHPARGWVGPSPSENAHGPAARMDPVACASCHQGAGEALCVGCHKVGGVGGNIHPPGFKSHLRLRQDQPCRACHGGP